MGALWLVTRALYAVVSYVSLALNAVEVPRPRTPVGGVTALVGLLDRWQQWDASYYLAIAVHGYASAQWPAFFPLYPLLIKLGTLLFGIGSALAVALVVSNVAALGAFIGIGLLAFSDDGTRSSSATAVRVTAAYPFAFFLAAPFAESLFLVFVVFALLCARRGAWGGAALAAFFAGLTHPTAIILVLPLLWEYGRHAGWWRRGAWSGRGAWRERVRLHSAGAVALLVGAVPLAIALFAAYLGRATGHTLAFLSAHAYWNRQTWAPWSTLHVALAHALGAQPFTYDQVLIWADVVPVVVFGLLTLLLLPRQPVAYSLYMLGLLFTVIISTVPDQPELIQSAGRLLVVSVPVFLMLGRWTGRRPWLDLLLVSGGFLLQALFLVFFLAGGWIE